MTLASVAGFGAPNYGDLLYAVMMRELVGHRVRLEFFGLPSQLAAPQVPMRPIAELYRSRPTGVLVGGGDILRVDWDVVARDHVGRSNGSPWSRALERERARRYRRAHLGYPAAGPFFVDPRQLPSAPPVAYVSCAVPGPVPQELAPAVVDALSQALSVTVRDERSRDLLVEAGVERGSVGLAPDCVLALARVWPRDRLTERGRELLIRWGVPDSDEALVFQVAPWLAAGAEQMIRHQLARAAASGLRVVALPMGAYSGEAALLRRLIDGVAGSVAAPVCPVEDVAAVLATAEVVQCTSFHAGITAAVYGRRVLFLPGADRKARGLLAAVDADPDDFLAPTWASVEALSARRMNAGAVQRAASAASRAVDETLDSLLAGRA